MSDVRQVGTAGIVGYHSTVTMSHPTNHVTKKCRHDDAVTCFTCGKKGHKTHHHAKD